MKELSWNPILRGVTYCAPACGRGCTRKEYEAAVAQAVGLAAELGKGWEPHVWENLGWHWAARKNGLKVHPGIVSERFTAFLGSPNSPGGRWAEKGDTPEAAVRNVVSAAKDEIESLKSNLDEWSQ